MPQFFIGMLETVPRQFVYRHFVYDTSSTDTSSNDISSTSVSVSITANQQRPLSYSFAKTCYIFSGIQLLITEKTIFINPASIEWKLIFIHAYRLISSFYLREKLFRSIQLLFQHRNAFINPTSISGNSFFHQYSFHFKVTISNNFVDEMSLDEVSVDEVS